MTMREIAPGLWAHATGAAWLPEARAALAADIHLGYAWALRRRGQLAPPAGGGVRAKLERMLDELQPRTLVALGDLVHAPRPGEEERRGIEELAAMICSRTGLIIVRGNHDRALARDFPALAGRLVDRWEAAGWLAVHGDVLEAAPEQARLILGHFHPAIAVRDAAGVAVRVPAFLAFPRAVVLPAFSPLAAGWDLRRGLPEALRPFESQGRPRAWAVSGHAVAGPLACGRRAQSVPPGGSMRKPGAR